MRDAPDTDGFAAYEAAREAPKPAPIWIDDAGWVESDIPRRPWIAPGYLLRGAVTLLIGPPSAMKSSLMLAWGCALGLYHTFGRFAPVAAARTLLYNVEDDQTEQRRRLSAVLRGFGAMPTDIQGRVIRAGPAGIGTLLTRDETGRIRFTAALDKLRECIGAFQIDVLIVDPLAELHTAEENDNTALRAVIAAFRELAIECQIAVAILHHTRKGSAASPGDPDTARGASSIIGAARVALTLTGMAEADAQAFGLPTGAEARARFIRLDDTKQNYAALRAAEWFEKTAVVLDNGEAVAAAAPWTPPAAKLATQADLAALAIAIELGAPGGEPWSPKLSKEPRSIRALLAERGFATPGAQKAAMSRLTTTCGVEAAAYRRPNRVAAMGLRIADLPAVEWIGAPPAGQ